MPSYAKYTGISGGGGGGGGSGTVTSVALADGSSTPIYTVTGSPVTTSGTLTETLKTQSANKVFAGPTTGVAAQPTFRSLVAADLPFAVGNLTDAGTDGITVTGGTGSVIGSGTSIAQHVADSTHNGYLSSSDWTTFNGKQAALTIGNLTDAGTDGITVTGGTGAIIGSGTSIAQHVSDVSHNGYLSSTDWGTFNNKADYTATSNVTSWTLDNVTGYTINTTFVVIGKVLIGSITFSGGTPSGAAFAINIPGAIGTISSVYPGGVTFAIGSIWRAVSGQGTPAPSNGVWPLWVDPTASTSKIFVTTSHTSNTVLTPTTATVFIGNQGYFGTFVIQLA